MNSTSVYARGLRACFVFGAFLFAIAAFPAALRSDEGMWLFNQLPSALLKQRYGFEPDAAWAEHVLRSSVRVSTGGSGSFVSRDGLVLTNHHVAAEAIQTVSTKEKNYVEDGFYARGREDEVRCPGVEIIALWETEDVTDRVNAAVAAGLDPGAAQKARRGAIASIEEESKKASSLHSEVVTLYRGGRYHLYRYRRWDDVRLVFAPEMGMAFFGGDADNFEFPRYCLDMALLRVYENGQPAKVEHHLRWAAQGAADGDLVFVSGHPGSTQRLNTADDLRFLRDVSYPRFLQLLYRREIALEQFSLRGPEQARIAKDDLFSVQNSRKALRGILAGLLDPKILEAKVLAEARLKSSVLSNPASGASLADWDRLSAAFAAHREFFDEWAYLESGRGFWSQLFGRARSVVRLAEETQKPSTERLPEYRDSALPSLKLRLFSEEPIYPELEKAKLSDSLTALAETLGAGHPFVHLVLSGRSPQERAHELVEGTKLHQVEEVKRLVEGGAKAVAESADAMVRLAKAVNPHTLALRRKYDDLVQGVRTEAYANISKAAFAMTGTSAYPDATFTLRLAFGVVKGWKEDGRDVPPFTTLGGAFRHHEEHGGKEPYALPARWLAAGPTASGRSGSALRTDMHLNFVSTADIIGGNSGSPVINRKGELVGLIFDGNIHSLVLDIAYTEEKARAVAVNAEAIIEAMRAIYGMEWLVWEILGRRES